ncbi:MAG TPA: inositol 2-dehydrogenase [Thermoanaerobaculia bacterium]
MKRIGIGVLGYGRIGRIHADNVRASQFATLVKVADPFFGAGIDAPDDIAWTPDVQSVIDDPAVDAVMICTPTPTHAPMVLAAAAAKKQIFCEKPLDLEIDVATRAVEAAQRAGVILQVGFNRRFDPSFRRVRDAVRDGEIGSLCMLRVISRDPAPPPVEYVRDSGGLFLDMMIHDFDMVRFVSGSEVEEVQAFGMVRVDPRIGEAGDVDTAVVSLRLASGALAVIENSRRAIYGYDQRVEAFGVEGAIEAGNRTASTTQLKTLAGVRVENPLSFFTERYEAAYRLELAAFVDAVRSGKEPECSGADALPTLAIAAAARRSMRTGRPEAVAAMVTG